MSRSRDDDGAPPTKAARTESSSPGALSPLTRPSQHQPRVSRVVFTGGPCAGKSTLLAKLTSEIGPRERIKVFAVPEAATLLVGAGLQWSQMKTDEQVFEAQLALIRVQMALEDQLTAIAHATGEQCLVICDRGTMDGRAYSTPEMFKRILAAIQQTEAELWLRYDGVIHLVTAADGAESFYSLDNNVARFENAEQAKDVDHRLRQMYLGHPQLKIVDNAVSFEHKINVAIDHVYSFLNRRAPAHRTKRYLLRGPPDWSRVPGIKVQTNITTSMLVPGDEGESRMLQKRTAEDGQEIFVYHSWRGDQLASQHRITKREYDLFLSNRDPQKADVSKTNTAFSCGGGLFDVALVSSPPWVEGMCQLYVEGNVSELPEFLSVLEETTGVHRYSNEGMSVPPETAPRRSGP